ncbi:hypothetical protein FACS1894122_03140 [Alphaproteobacteria bacterium]|nr:hypothetical protein FACS1894122_03140 [Alphaproteobacteria bacterium]
MRSDNATDSIRPAAKPSMLGLLVIGAYSIMKNYIGIDVAKQKADIFSLENSTYLTVENDEEFLMTELSKFASSETLIVLENTGGYEQTCIKVALKR